MGVLPLQFTEGQNRKTLGLKGDETFTITGINDLKPGGTLSATIKYADGKETSVTLQSRIDTANELEYYRNGGILHYVLRNLNK